MEENSRIAILVKQIKKNMEKIANTLNWNLTLLREDLRHNYVVCKVEREGENHKFAVLYSQSTDRTVYQSLAQEVEIIFINELSFEENNFFSKDCNIPVIPENEFLYVISDWNMEFLKIPIREEDLGKGCGVSTKVVCTDHIFIVEENPMEQIYTQLQALTSKAIALKSVEYHVLKQGKELEKSVKEKKAEGVAYLVQNAIDYYDSAATKNLTQRMLNLYYGTIAFMEAEMLMKGDQYRELSEIESITKNGHGMMTFGTAENGLNDFYVGVINQGLFPMWIKHRGANISRFPNSKKNAEKSEIYYESLNSLLYCIPELENILMEIDENFKPGYLFPCYDMSLNHTGSMIKSIYYERKYVGSYVNMIDQTKRADEQLVQELPGRITLIGEYRDRNTKEEGWRVFVQHKKGESHYSEYKTHKGLSVSMLMKPVLGCSNDWEVYAVMILYALSIIVRYMPNLWARIIHGSLDCYKSVFYQFSRVVERELTQIFLETLTGKNIVIRHPQTLI